MSEQEMDRFEHDLAKALQRVSAPEGFAQRVMGRVCADPDVDGASVVHGARAVLDDGVRGAGSDVSEARHGAPRVLVMRKPMVQGRAWIGGAIAAVLVLGVFGAEQVHVRREREKAEMATQQFEAAVLVTDQALQQTREQLARAGLKLGD
jgi:hypothetical protein